MVGTARSVGLFAKQEPALTGTARYAQALAHELAQLGWGVLVQRSRPPFPRTASILIGRATGIDVGAFWSSYPLLPGRAPGALLHLTSQTVATSIALARPARPTIVTVHDILPLTLRDHPRLGTLRRPIDVAFYHLAMRGVRRADMVLADSQYTADELVRAVGMRAESIRIVPLGVDLVRFRVGGDDGTVRARYGVEDERPRLIYVGSEDPRKNLAELLRAIRLLSDAYPTLELVKVGPPHHLAERQRLLELAADLDIARRVRWIEHVPDADLPLLYRSATACVIPSLFEGFGLPVLEAMACGVPVVCANCTSLPEVAGDAALLVQPTADGIAGGVRRVLGDAELRGHLATRGLGRAARYTWRRTAELTVDAYQELLTAHDRH